MTSAGLLVLAVAVLVVPNRVSAAAAESRSSEDRPRELKLLPRRSAPQVDSAALAFVLDLVAAALGAGLSVDLAIAVVARAVTASGEPGLISAVAPLARVGKLIEWGSDPRAAWESIEHEPGYARVVTAGRRCAASGARLAGALVAAGDQLRADRHAAASAAAQRVGVWSLLPLGLCFLPAFVCIGIVPVVGGLATGLMSGAP